MFVCICCGDEASTLYTIYSPEIINCQSCKSCGKIVDKYVEYDIAIVIIDLLVCKLEAYRHILWNVYFPRLPQLFILSCILSGFSAWITTTNLGDLPIDTVHATINSELYVYILLKAFSSFLIGCTLYLFGFIIRFKIKSIDIIKVLALTNLCSLLTLLAHPWRFRVAMRSPIWAGYFPAILTFISRLTTTIPSYKALTNASYTFCCLVSFVACSTAFYFEIRFIQQAS
ncbi:unnamed protein product [Schistocephalus solidus]|uniref:Protein ARV n=1 Tax=Schistocephalus solidus TaxID=70667 RepID=A0A0X3NZX4_SCHSO|nr:unnamed protein product [Schistocephalus solidus]